MNPGASRPLKLGPTPASQSDGSTSALVISPTVLTGDPRTGTCRRAARPKEGPIHEYSWQSRVAAGGPQVPYRGWDLRGRSRTTRLGPRDVRAFEYGARQNRVG